MLEVKVPDIGDYKDVPVIEVLVKAGDTVSAEDSLVTLESDKATLDVPSPSAGVIKNVIVKVGDKVSEGSVILALEPADGASTKPAAAPEKSAAPAASAKAEAASPPPTRAGNGHVPLGDLPGEGPSGNPPLTSTTEVRVPDIGDFKDIPVIEVFVKPGDIIKVDDPLVSLESDKATMEVPSTLAGVVQGVRVSVGDKVSEGTVLVSLSAVARAVPSARLRTQRLQRRLRPRPLQLRPQRLHHPQRQRQRPHLPRKPPQRQPQRPLSTPLRSRAPTRRHPFASLRANSASISGASAAADPRAASCARTCRPSSSRR